MSRIVRLPIITIRRDIIQIHRGRDTAQLLEELHAQALRDMPITKVVSSPSPINIIINL